MKLYDIPVQKITLEPEEREIYHEREEEVYKNILLEDEFLEE